MKFKKLFAVIMLIMMTTVFLTTGISAADEGPDYTDYDTAIQSISQGAGYYETSPIQPTHRLPKEYASLLNGHNGTHHFLIDDFCRAYETGKLSPTNIWEVARWNIPGLTAHKSAMAGGQTMDVIDLGNPPADWEVLNWK